MKILIFLVLFTITVFGQANSGGTNIPVPTESPSFIIGQAVDNGWDVASLTDMQDTLKIDTTYSLSDEYGLNRDSTETQTEFATWLATLNGKTGYLSRGTYYLKDTTFSPSYVVHIVGQGKEYTKIVVDNTNDLFNISNSFILENVWVQGGTGTFTINAGASGINGVEFINCKFTDSDGGTFISSSSMITNDYLAKNIRFERCEFSDSEGAIYLRGALEDVFINECYIRNLAYTQSVASAGILTGIGIGADETIVNNVNVTNCIIDSLVMTVSDSGVSKLRAIYGYGYNWNVTGNTVKRLYITGSTTQDNEAVYIKGFHINVQANNFHNAGQGSGWITLKEGATQTQDKGIIGNNFTADSWYPISNILTTGAGYAILATGRTNIIGNVIDFACDSSSGINWDGQVGGSGTVLIAFNNIKCDYIGIQATEAYHTNIHHNIIDAGYQDAQQWVIDITSTNTSGSVYTVSHNDITTNNMGGLRTLDGVTITGENNKFRIKDVSSSLINYNGMRGLLADSTSIIDWNGNKYYIDSSLTNAGAILTSFKYFATMNTNDNRVYAYTGADIGQQGFSFDNTHLEKSIINAERNYFFQDTTSSDYYPIVLGTCYLANVNDNKFFTADDTVSSAIVIGTSATVTELNANRNYFGAKIDDALWVQSGTTITTLNFRNNSYNGIGSDIIDNDGTLTTANYSNNTGWITINSDTVVTTNDNSITDSVITVTHGLNITPTIDNISVNLISTLGSASYYYVLASDITSTQFKIRLNADAGQVVRFSWQIN